MEKNVVARDNGKVMVLSEKDKRVIKMISTKHDGSPSKAHHRERAVLKEKKY